VLEYTWNDIRQKRKIMMYQDFPSAGD
jgi:hypothetical protein